jgi:hypothetical protein
MCKSKYNWKRNGSLKIMHQKQGFAVKGKYFAFVFSVTIPLSLQRKCRLMQVGFLRQSFLFAVAMEKCGHYKHALLFWLALTKMMMPFGYIL